MIAIQIICLGKLNQTFWMNPFKEYSKRLTRYGTVKCIELKEEILPKKPSKKEIQIALSKEANAIQSKINPSDALYLLDSNGKMFTSVEFSQLLQEELLEKNKSISFVIGSSHGLSEALKKKGKCISFSRLTFPHQLFRIILLEQIYRAFKIQHGETYHK